jgi:serine protease Do
MDDNQNFNQWNKDDFEMNREKQKEEKYFSYTEQYPMPKKKKKGFFKKHMRAIAIIVLSAVIGSGVTAIGFSFAIPYYVDKQIAKSGQYDNLNGNENFTPTTKGNTDSMSVADVAAKVGPAVVGIVSKVPQSSIFGTNYATASGSGFIISEDGLIATNNHVIEGAKDITVMLSNGESKKATVVGADATSDLAVIKMESGKYYSSSLGSSGDLRVGDRVVAIGNPLGQEFAGSVTVGYVSALNRTVTTGNKTMNLIQTDAAINEGNSGGPLVNLQGEIIGINTLKMAATGVEGLGFAIPMDEAKPIINDLANYGYVKGRPVIGLTGRNITSEAAKYYGYPEGIFVEAVTEGGAAQKAGIRRGDIITHFNNERIKSMEELNAKKNKLKAGDTVSIELDRSGEIIKLELQLSEETKE